MAVIFGTLISLLFLNRRVIGFAKNFGPTHRYSLVYLHVQMEWLSLQAFVLVRLVSFYKKMSIGLWVEELLKHMALHLTGKTE